MKENGFFRILNIFDEVPFDVDYRAMHDLHIVSTHVSTQATT